MAPAHTLTEYRPPCDFAPFAKPLSYLIFCNAK